MIYHHALTATPIATFYALPRKWQPISLLHTSHLIHTEAFTHLYTAATFVIDIYPCSIITPMQTPPQSHSRMTITQPHFAALARTIELRIHWADPAWANADTLPPALQDASASKKLRHTLRIALDTLVHFASLRHINITWSAPPAGAYPATAAAAAATGPSKAKIPVLLRPLKALREARPGVVIRLPDGGAMSSAELAKGQEGARPGPMISAAACEALRDVREMVEDAVEGCEEVREVLRERKRAIWGLD